MNVCRIPLLSLPSRPTAEERVHLSAGSVYVSCTPALVSTIVSSSVAVCLWSPRAAGIGHFVMPRGGTEPSLRFGNHCLATLLDRLGVMGIDRSDLAAALFGGAVILGGSDLSRRNVAAAREFLRKQGVAIVREDAGGSAARRVTFRTVDGSTVIRTL